jgi:CHAD domain-containing protein
VRELPSRHSPFQKRLDAFTRELSDLHSGSVEAVHHTRVASRRLRELLPLLQLDAESTRKLSRRLKRVTNALGVMRELDVMALLIEELQANHRYAPAALRRIQSEILPAREAARVRLASRLPTEKLERIASQLERAAHQVALHDAMNRLIRPTGPAHGWMWALDARLVRRAAAVRAAIESAGALYSSEPLHAVRVAIKKLRYAAELATELGQPRMTADVAILKTGQDILGRLHDLEVLLARSRAIQASPSGPPCTRRDLQSFVRAIEQDCRVLHGRYMLHRTALLTVAGRLSASTLSAIVATAGEPRRHPQRLSARR